MAVSVGKVDITPAAGMPMAGYGLSTPRLATGVNAPLYARCTVLWDNGSPNVIVTADLLGFGRATNQAIRTQVEAMGVARSDFVLTATHTHNGPVLSDPIDPYTLYNVTDPAQLTLIQQCTTTMIDAIVDLVEATLAATRTACTLDYRVTQATFSRNREGLSTVERDVPVLLARDLTGVPLAVLFGYGCHPVAAGSQTLFDPDYPGVAAQRIENESGAHAQFVLGTHGDQDPLDPKSLPRSTELGTTLGNLVITAMGTAGRAITGPILTAYKDVTLPLDITVNPGNMAVVRANFAKRLTVETLNSFYGRHAQRMIAQIDASTFATAVQLPLQVWRLGGTPLLKMVFAGGELIAGFGAYFRAHNGGTNAIWMASNANETPAYIPSDELLFLHPGLHYACGWMPDFPGIGGGAQAVYGWLGRFRGRKPGTTTTGVEQIVITEITSML
jgi:hypothetical protein